MSILIGLLPSRFLKLHDLVVFALRSTRTNVIIPAINPTQPGRRPKFPGLSTIRSIAIVGPYYEGILRKARHGISILGNFGLGHWHSFVMHAGHIFVLHRTFCFEG
ncbi:MAG TPA: hypothetical protein VN901_04150 [Candidatus Acidoferrales bacterium]|nr:hypothetical protein [Candidatus Acidoferrales bacterium]